MRLCSDCRSAEAEPKKYLCASCKSYCTRTGIAWSSVSALRELLKICVDNAPPLSDFARERYRLHLEARK